MVGPLATELSSDSGNVERGVDDQLDHRDQVSVIGQSPVAAVRQISVSRVVRSAAPLRTHDVVRSVIID